MQADALHARAESGVYLSTVPDGARGPAAGGSVVPGPSASRRSGAALAHAAQGLAEVTTAETPRCSRCHRPWNPTTRYCRRCDRTRPLRAFHAKDWYCRECRAAYNRAYYWTVARARRGVTRQNLRPSA